MNSLEGLIANADTLESLLKPHPILPEAPPPQVPTCASDKAGPFFLVLRQATRLAGLFHDLGKASALFQHKLRDASVPQYEPLRHEVLSYLMLVDSLAPTADEPDTDFAWLERLIARPERIGAQVTETLLLSPSAAKIAKELVLSADHGKKFLSGLAKTRSKRPLSAGVLWLVLTHHGLPGTRKADNLERHIHPDRAKDAAVWAQNLRPAEGVLPWQDPRWLESVRAVATRLRAELHALEASSKGALAGPNWVLALAHIARPALVLGDYKASILKTETYALSQADVVLANTRDKSTLGGDSLATHLLSVKSACDLLFRLQRTVKTAFLTTSVPDTVTHGIRCNDLPDRFQWQKDAADKVREVCKQNPGAGFFGVVVSSTGAGKTIGGVRLMDAACAGLLRYTLPLSRKSLTLQAGRDYREDTGLDSASVAVAIGSRVTQVLGELSARGSDGLKSAPLSVHPSDLTLNMDETLLVDYAGQGREGDTWRKDFDGADDELFKTKKALDLISAPILVTTADHLTGAVEMLRGKQSLMSLRLLSSDLLLDEIDNYGARDLVSLGKLVFCAGMYGRKVVLMSATMAQPIVQSFYSAYCKGLELAGLLQGKSIGHVCAVISNEAAPYAAIGTTAGAFLAEYRAQVQDFLKAVEARPVRRTVGELDVSQAKTSNECFDIVKQEAVRLHGLNKLTDPNTGVSYSVGFVRFNSAKTCFEASKYLSGQTTRPSAHGGPVIKYVTYHAKQIGLALNAIDLVLGRVLKRSASGGLTGHSEVADLLASVAQAGGSEVVFVILTTSLLETGRDQDYDWAVFEPRSNRGEHQAMGRVRRHRHDEWLAQNSSVLSHPIRNIVKRAGGWGLPGVERVNSPYRVNFVLCSALQPLARAMGIAFNSKGPSRALLSARESLPVAQWESYVSARQCLETPSTYEENPIGSLEQLEMYAHLVDSGKLSDAADGLTKSTPAEPKPLAAYLAPGPTGLPLAWCAGHAVSTKFRSSDDNRDEFQVFFNPKTAPGIAKVATQEPVPREVPIERLTAVAVNESAYWFNMPLLVAQSWVELQVAMPTAGPNLYQEAFGCKLSSCARTHLELEGEHNLYLGFCVR